MRHGKKFNHLSRKKAHRKAMLSNMANSLIEHKRINTTVAKAKALRVYVEPIISRAKDDSTHSRRVVFRYLQNKDSVTELFRTIGPKVMDRPGGYTRIIKTGHRKGDGADMCLIELVDFNELYSTGETKKKKRSRRGGGKKVAAPAAKVVEEVVEEATETAEEVVEETTEAVEETVDQVEETAEASAEETEEKSDDSNEEEKKDEA